MAAYEPATLSNATGATSPTEAANEPATPSGLTGATSFAAATSEPPTPSSKFMPNVPGLRLTGAIGVWGRGFPEAPHWDGQRNAAIWPNVEGWVKAEYTWNNGTDLINFMPYARKDFFGSRSL